MKAFNSYVPTIVRMVEELLESEGVDYVDIKYLDSGSSSTVYEIGDKVLKIGAVRNVYNMPNHPRILQPLIRLNLIDEKWDNTEFACVEIMDKVKRIEYEATHLEQLYQIYKELRDAGIVWTDARPTNLGRLLKRNIPTLNGEEMDVEPNSVGFINGKNEETLDEGELVILDTDYIYPVDSPDIYWPNNEYYQLLERRWQQEKQAEIAKKHNEEQKEVETSKEQGKENYEK